MAIKFVDYGEFNPADLQFHVLGKDPNDGIPEYLMSYEDGKLEAPDLEFLRAIGPLKVQEMNKALRGLLAESMERTAERLRAQADEYEAFAKL